MGQITDIGVSLAEKTPFDKMLWTPGEFNCHYIACLKNNLT